MTVHATTPDASEPVESTEAAWVESGGDEIEIAVRLRGPRATRAVEHAVQMMESVIMHRATRLQRREEVLTEIVHAGVQAFIAWMEKAKT